MKDRRHIRILAGVDELLALRKNFYDIVWPIYKINSLSMNLKSILDSINAYVVFTSKASFYALKKDSPHDLFSLFKPENKIKIASVGEYTKAFIKESFKDSNILTPKERGLQSFFKDYYSEQNMFFILTGKNSKSLGDFNKKKNVKIIDVYELIESGVNFKILLESQGISYSHDIDYSFICKSKDILVQVLKSLSQYLKCSIKCFPSNIHFELWEKSAKNYAESIALKFRHHRESFY